MSLLRLPLVLVAALSLAACAENEILLDGDREDVRLAEGAATGAAEDAPNLTLGPARNRTDWSHEAGNSSHNPGHVAVNYPLTPSWSRDIGRGASREGRITAAPVVAKGVVYTLDAAAIVHATSIDGVPLWSRDLTPDGENSLDGFGGGLAVNDTMLVAGTGFGELVAMDAATGEVSWRQEMTAPVRAAPTIRGSRVYAVSRDDNGYAIDLSNGRIRWRTQGTEPGAGVVGGASPAADANLVVMPFASGEVVGALARNGRRVWTALLSGGRRGLVRGRLADVTGDPVLAGDSVYVATQGGRFSALNRRNGSRRWVVNEGALGPALVVGGSVFIVTDEAQLQRRNTSDGALIWSVALPLYKDAKDRDAAFLHASPLLAGERLLVASSDGALRSFDPRTGAELGSTQLSDGAAVQPAIVDGRVFVVTSGGTLHAFN